MSADRDVVTRVARIQTDDHRFAGYGALTELLGHETFLGAAFLGICGRRPTDDERSALDALATSMLAADPRIWPLRITRLVASYGGITAGFVAGQLCEEQGVIGPWVSGPAAELLVSLRAAAGDDADDMTFGGHLRSLLAEWPRIPGFGVAFRDRDERFDALRVDVGRRGRAGLPYWRLLERTVTWLDRERKLPPNIAMGCAGVLLDMSLSPKQVQTLSFFMITATFLPNAFEGAQQPSALLRELPTECVRYAGRGPRDSGRR